MTNKKVPGITIINLIEDFLELLEEDEDVNLSDEAKSLIAASISHGVAAAINCIMNGYEKKDGTIVPVIAAELFEDAFEMSTAYLTSEDDDEDDEESSEDDEDDFEPLEGASVAQAELDEQLDSSVNEPKQGWIQLDNSSKRKAN